ncbi:thiamine phosphate synthase [Thiomicrorhabdus aquaedulcis]|uniref:thiamine phosphate synthase n=1 Tax=Thiomicrorhabdus aquaedulcis TaxID=2211106 RepID=UPI001E48E304|nr:thiamine phosphate synthase [Thiomicrorhabdus aquaedulcis]
MPSPTMRVAKPRVSGLYIITQPDCASTATLLSQVKLALQGGARWVQYRDKTATFAHQLHTACLLKQLCKTYQAWLIINDHLPLALQSQADGLHLGQNDAQLKQARQVLGQHAIIGVSCYNDLPRAKQMQDQGADYVAFGRFFTSNTKPNAPQAELSTLQLAKQQLRIPVVAIGGVTANNTQQLIKHGADSVAVIHGVFAQPDITAAAQSIQQQFLP